MNFKKGVLCATCVSFSLLVQAYDWSDGGAGPDYVFGSSTEPLVTGGVTVPDSQTADSITAYVASDQTVTFAGGALTLSENGFLCAGGVGKMVFSTPIATAGAVAFSDANAVTTDDLYPTSTTDSKTVQENASIDDFELVSGYLKSNYMDKDAPPFNVVRGNGTLDAQLQFVDGSWLKCGKVHLENKDGNIIVTPVYGRYVESSEWPLGSDFDTIPTGDAKGKARTYPIVTGGTGNGFGLKNLTLSRLAESVGIEIAGPFAPGGAVTVAKGAVVRFQTGTPSGSDVFSAPLALNGRLLVADRERMEFTGNLSGQGGTLTLEPWKDAPVTGVVMQVGDKDVVADIPSTILTGVKLTSISNVSDVYIRNSSGSAIVSKATVCQFVNNGKEVTFQAQYFEAGQKLIKCACIKLTQNGSNIAKTLVETPYVYFSSDAEAEAFLGSDIYSVKSSWRGNSGGYNPTAMTVYLDDTAAERHEVVLSGADNGQETSTIEVGSGRRLVLNAASCVPSNGSVTVLAGGEAEVRVARAATNVNSVIDVRPGGVFRQLVNDAFNADNWGPTFRADGGELALKRGDTTAPVPDCGSYFNIVELAGGARMTGLRTRLGNAKSNSPVWTIRAGTSSEPVRLTSGVNFVGVGQKQSFTVDVDDFADGADLIQEPSEVPVEGDAQFGDFNSNHDWTMHLLKRGAGTWQIGSVSSNYYGKVKIEAGEIAFSVSESLPNSEWLELRGGKLTAMAGTTQTLKWQEFSAASGLGLGTGASLVFTSVPAGDWAYRLTVTGDVGETALKMPALTAQQLGMIRINGHRAVQDENGYLHETIPGMAIIFR